MNDISSHKLGSMFAKALTEREAPGYKSLIYRPQDLKSIKVAITHGNKALANATLAEDAETSLASINKSITHVWVNVNEDVIPPKGIVNSAQLEKEVLRMFANAVMFNPDPLRDVGPAFSTRSRVDVGNGEPARRITEEEANVVKDTREMFGAVERIIAAWRDAERVGEDLPTVVVRENEEEAADEDAEMKEATEEEAEEPEKAEASEEPEEQGEPEEKEQRARVSRGRGRARGRPRKGG